jgi:hypothetical protein
MLPLSDHHKKGLLNAIQREWTALFSVVDRLSLQQMITPDAGGWSPKDNLAHLSAWLKILLDYHFDGKPGSQILGLPKELDENFDFNKVNAFLFEQNRDRSLEAVLAELKAEYARLLARLEAMSLADLMKPRHADDPQQRPLVLWVMGDTTEHFAEHRATLEKLLK